MEREDSGPVTEFGKRLWLAIAEKKVTPTRTERESGLKQGYITQIKQGKISNPGSQIVRALADYLDVGFEWLSTGRGPMHPVTQEESTFEIAQRFAQTQNARQDAIDAAIARHRDVVSMTVFEWITAFDVEARRLEREGVPRPEIVEAERKTARRLANKRARVVEASKLVVAEIEQLQAEKSRLDAEKAARFSPKKHRLPAPQK